MSAYPEELLPHKGYPSLLEDNNVLPYNFVRETQEDIYCFLKQDIPIEDLLEKIIVPQKPNEVFEFSVNLYGFYNESHIGIRASNEFNVPWTVEMPDISADSICNVYKEMFPLYLKAEQLYQQEINFQNGQGSLNIYILSFSHKPFQCNYWHFQLYTKDSCTGNSISRNNKSRRLKFLAKHILEQYVVKAICQKPKDSKFSFFFENTT